MRCVVTVGVAALSYVLVERPIRDGVHLRRERGAGRGAAASPPVAGVGTVAALVVVATAVHEPRSGPGPLPRTQRWGT
jgi:peptidoglycan/LPS O-acetylase OafA/YrhL